MAIELKVPSVGESITQVQIGRWLKQPGDAVAKDDPLVEIETDKVTLELPAPADGAIREITVQQGGEAQVGDVIGHMEEGAPGTAPGRVPAPGKSAETAPAKDAAPEAVRQRRINPSAQAPAASKDDGPQPTPGDRAGGGNVRVMPAAQRLLDEHGLQASDIEATGPGGRLLKGDVLRHVESGNGKAPPEESTPAPTAKPTPSGVGGDRPTPHADASSGAGGTSGGGDREEELVPMTPLRRSIAQRLVDAQQTAALLTTFNDCDMTAVMDLRKRHQDAFVKRYGIKLGFMSIFVKATIHALSQFPALNAEVRGTDIAYRNYFDIGIAIGGGKGLVVPIIRDAQTLSLAQIEQQIADYAQKAKANKITLDDMTGGTFTITNGGIYGSLLSTPIVNPPQSGVLGMHNIVRRPIAVGDPKTGDERIEIRPMMNLALTYDHRVVDGREAVTALRLLKEAIEEPARMLIEI